LTRATDAAAASGLAHRVVRTEPARSAEEAAERQAIPLDRLLKTIVVRRGEGDFVFVLVPGDREIDWPKLRRHLGVSRLSLPDRAEAERVTGYAPGTITPYGSTTPWPVVLDASAATPGTVAIGGGAPGVNLHADALDLAADLGAETADVTSPRAER
jgi:Cys-tRNA(Pro) deacylase